MKVIEYPANGIKSYIAKVIEDDDDTYLVELYSQDQPIEEEEDNDDEWPAIIRWILWFFEDPYQEEEEEPEPEPIVRRRFPYSISYLNAINKTVWEHERPIRYKEQLFEWDGQVFEPPKPSPQVAVRLNKEEPHIEYIEHEIEVNDQGSSHTLKQKVPEIKGKKPRYLSEDAWLLIQEQRKRNKLKKAKNV